MLPTLTELIIIILTVGTSVNAAANGSGAKMIISHGRDLVITRLDPIVNPGKISGHMHSIVGGNKFGSVYDSAELLSSDCTTANIKTDHSNYWTPTLYFKFSNGSYGVVNGGVDFVNTYYQNRFHVDDTNSGKVFAFPVGFSMLGGNATNRGISINSVNKAQSWHCLGGGDQESPNFPFLAGNNACTSWRGQIYMPNCWNGVDATSKDNSHVAYPKDDVQNGPCPSGWKRIPTLFYEFVYKIDSKIYSPDKGTFMLSNGDTTGYGFHGDFTNGWDQDVIEKLVKECYGSTQGDGACDQAVAMQKGANIFKGCSYKGDLVSEETGQISLLNKLPGCNPIYGATETNSDCSNSAKILMASSLDNSTYLYSAALTGTSVVSTVSATNTAAVQISSSTRPKKKCSKQCRAK